MNRIREDAEFALQGFDAQSIRNMTFPYAGWTAQQNVLVASDKGIL
jgi:hypothetical protein